MRLTAPRRALVEVDSAGLSREKGWTESHPRLIDRSIDSRQNFRRVLFALPAQAVDATQAQRPFTGNALFLFAGESGRFAPNGAKNACHQNSSGLPLSPPCESAFCRNHAPQRFHQHLVTLIEGLRRRELARIVAQSTLSWDKDQRRRNTLLDR